MYFFLRFQGIKTFVTFLNSYENLFTDKCRKCGYHLRKYIFLSFLFSIKLYKGNKSIFFSSYSGNNLPPTWREFKTLIPYHEDCKPWLMRINEKCLLDVETRLIFYLGPSTNDVTSKGGRGGLPKGDLKWHGGRGEFTKSDVTSKCTKNEWIFNIVPICFPQKILSFFKHGAKTYVIMSVQFYCP